GVLVISRDVTERVHTEAVLRESEARHRHEAEAKRFLAEAGAVLAGSLDYTTTLANVAELAVPLLADWCAVYTVGEGGAIQRVGLACSRPEDEALIRAVHQVPLDPAGPHPVAVALRTGEAEFTPEVDERARRAAPRDE